MSPSSYSEESILHVYAPKDATYLWRINREARVAMLLGDVLCDEAGDAKVHLSEMLDNTISEARFDGTPKDLDAILQAVKSVRYRICDFDERLDPVMFGRVARGVKVPGDLGHFVICSFGFKTGALKASSSKYVDFKEWFLRPDSIAEQISNGNVALVPKNAFGGMIVNAGGRIFYPDHFKLSGLADGQFSYEYSSGDIVTIRNLFQSGARSSLHVIRRFT